MQTEMIDIEDLIPYANNSRKHSPEQVAKIASSIKEFGFTNPVLIDKENGLIAGHGRVMGARKLGIKQVPCIRLDHLSEAQKKAYIIADNKLALDAEWDMDLLGIELEELKNLDYDIRLTGFDSEQLKDFFEGETVVDVENPYTMKVSTPIYEPKDEKPNINELLDDKKYNELVNEIEKSNLPKPEKDFLIASASRHIVFNYAKIANFYAHSSKECQELMENNALVIIDFNKAIESGLVDLTNKLNDIIEIDEDE